MPELYETTHQQSTQPVRESQRWNLDKIISNFSITIKNFLNSSYICWLPCYCVPQHSNIMMTSSNGIFYTLLAICVGNSPVTGEFPTQWPVMRSFGGFFLYLCLNKRLSKQWWRWWFETPSCSLWRDCNGYLCPSPLLPVVSTGRLFANQLTPALVMLLIVPVLGSLWFVTLISARQIWSSL